LLAEGALASVLGQVDQILGHDDGPASAATLLVLEERLSTAISRLSS